MGIMDAFKNFKAQNKLHNDIVEDVRRGLGNDGEKWSRESYSILLKQYYEKYGANVFSEEVLSDLWDKTNIVPDLIKKDLKDIIKTWKSNENLKETVAMRLKTIKFNGFLKSNNLPQFDIKSKEKSDELTLTASNDEFSIKTIIRITDTFCTNGLYIIADCPDKSKQEKVILLLNQINCDSMLRYTMDKDGKIEAKFSYWAEEKSFDCNMLWALYEEAIDEIIENYSRIITEIEGSKPAQAQLGSQSNSTAKPKQITQEAKPKPATPPKPIQQSKPAPPKTLNESDLFNCVKAIPIRFDFSYPQMKENQKLNALCNMLLSGDMISQVLDAGNIENFEHNLQTKRLRNTNQEDYNKSLENNILFELYKYSSLMNLFKVLEDRKSDKVKVDYQKLWEQIQVECKTRIQNLSIEKKNNPAIHNLLQKYDYDTRKFKMVINDYIDVRENDYILSGMMSSILYIVMNSVFFGEINNQPILKMIKSYPSKEIMCMIEALIINTATLRLTTYANGGSMFERG